MNAIYSPSQTMTWLECRLKRALSRQWEPRLVGQRELGAILGKAFAAGVAHYNRHRNSEHSVGAPHLAVIEALKELDALKARGQVVAAVDEAQAEAIPDRASKAVAHYIAADPLPAEWLIAFVEEAIDASGARPDLVVGDGSGPVPVDYKTKLRVWGQNSEQRERNRGIWHAQFANSWQMLHYASHFNADRYYIVHVEMEPRFEASLKMHTIAPEVMGRWRQSAQQYWRQMEVTANSPLDLLPMAAVHETKFGPCPYQAACFEHFLNPERMARDYVRKERKS